MQAVKYAVVSANTVIARGFAKYYGAIVTTATATAAVQVRDSVAAAAGNVIDTFPAASAVGTRSPLSHPIECTTGLTFDLNGGTGTLVVMYEGSP